MLRKRFCLTLWFLIALTPASIFADEAAPSWLQEASKRQTPSFNIDDVPGVVLHDEQVASLDNEGKLTIRTTHALRVLRREGRFFARASALYLQSASKVTEMKAWLMRRDGSIKYFGKNEIIDAISDSDDIYNEYRVKSVSAVDEIEEGGVFGYQYTVEERPIFTHDIWPFQGRLPTIISRYTLNLPNGWEARSVTFNREDIKPVISGTSYTWELRDLSPIPPEPGSPDVRNLAPRIAVNYFPTGATGTKTFATWQDVSRWGTEIHEPQVIVDDAVAIKARELTANATTELDKIRALANFVQNLQYISVDIGIASGNGYRPRPSNLVLQRGYGDCKDKANLMRAMLKVLKIEAYPVFIFAGDPTFVREEWASPSQFNHCIIAIKVSDSVSVPAVITHAKLGRLLIFDATDPHTLLGDFPSHEQGSFAVIAAGEDGGLVKMPVIPPDMNRLERTADVTLNANGDINGKIREIAVGQTATSFRGEYRQNTPADYKKLIEGWLTRGLSIAKATNITPKDDLSLGKFTLDVDFNALSYAQVMQGKLMVFKPAIIGRLERFSLSGDRRYHPYLLDSTAYTESIKIKLPEGFVVDEMPEPTKLDSFIGKYSATYEVKDGHLVFNRSMTLNKTTVPADKYESLRQFFGRVRAAEGAPVVLLKQ